MLHKATPVSEDRWRIAAVVSLVMCLGVVWLWLNSPGRLYRFDRGGTEYIVRADFGRLLLYQWSARGGLNIVWDLRLWPFAVLTALLPIWVLWRFGPHRPKKPPGFPIEQKGSP